MSEGAAATAPGLMARWFGRAPRQAGEDWALWRRACEGEAVAATELVRRLTPQARGLALQLLRRSEDAEDAVQESFLRLWGSRPSDARGASLATFFNTIVINRCKTSLGRRQELATEHELLTAIADAQQQPIEPDPVRSAGELAEAMQRLPARQRMALAMWAYADASVAEIAATLDLEANAAHQLLHRAKLALRQQLQKGESP